MQDIDYENLFIYMSLIFAISIFIILLFGCAFSSGIMQPSILENFFGEEDIKNKILGILKKNEKEIKNKEHKKKVSDIIDKIESDKIDIKDITLLIEQLKGFETDDSKSSEPFVSGEGKELVETKTKKDKKDGNDNKSKEKIKSPVKEDNEQDTDDE
jgi:hypothetical protein